jgi:hypothetical protein
VPATSFKVVSDTEITAVTPVENGKHYVVVVTPEGVAPNSPADLYTFAG